MKQTPPTINVWKLWNLYKLTVLKVALAATALVLVAAQLIPGLSGYLQAQKYLGFGLLIGLGLLVLDTLLSSRPSREEPSNKPGYLAHTSELSHFFPSLSKSRDVEIDIASYSSETFYGTLVGLLDSIARGETNIRRIKIRLLVPDCSRSLGVPCLVDSRKQSPAYRKMLVNRTKRFVDEFYNAFRRISNDHPQIEAVFQVRYHRLSPLLKFAILQKEYAYYGIYPIDHTPVTVGGQQQMFLDYRGERTALVRADKNSSSEAETTMFGELNSWFESVWNTADEVQ